MQPNVIGDPEDVCGELRYMAENENLLKLHYRIDDRSSTGYHSAMALAKLLRMKTCNWRVFFDSIERSGHKLKKVWLVQYMANGKHRYHMDKGFWGTHRWIVSLGCIGKEFWLKCGSGEVRHMLRHGSVVIMDKKASGFNPNSGMKHAGKGDAGGSWAVVFETVKV